MDPYCLSKLRLVFAIYATYGVFCLCCTEYGTDIRGIKCLPGARPSKRAVLVLNGSNTFERSSDFPTVRRILRLMRLSVGISSRPDTKPSMLALTTATMLREYGMPGN